MEFKREIFFRKKNTEEVINKPLEDEFVFDIKNVDFYDERTIKYLDDLKEKNLGEYYHTLEQLADLKVLNRQQEDLSEEKRDFLNKVHILKESDIFKAEKGKDNIWRINGMTEDEWNELDKENTWPK